MIHFKVVNLIANLSTRPSLSDRWDIENWYDYFLSEIRDINIEIGLLRYDLKVLINSIEKLKKLLNSMNKVSDTENIKEILYIADDVSIVLAKTYLIRKGARDEKDTQIFNLLPGSLKFEVLEVINEIQRDDTKKNYNDEMDKILYKEGSQSSPKLKIRQIALLHVYKGNPINMDNSSEIAKKYGYTNKYSGKGLYDDYTLYHKDTNRREFPETKVKFYNKVKLLESIEGLLADNERFKLELKALRQEYDKRY
jgi:hypothetical protein